MGNKNGVISNGILSVMLVVVLLVVDQIIKIAVKTNMQLFDSIWIADWFQIHFIENNGMAFGMTFINKYVLTTFRLVAIIFIGWYMYKQVMKQARTRYVVLLSLLLAGAAGNLIDCMFYGLVFSESTPYVVSTMVPWGEGYAGFLTGKVVDMFYFPLIQTTWPDWMPFCGGEEFIFFSPVFNFADACVSVGVVAMLLFCRKELATLGEREKVTETEESVEELPTTEEEGE